MRLAKYLAIAGLASRRGAEQIVRQGRVKVNDVLTVQPQTDVSASDFITVDGVMLKKTEKKYYLLLNKPPGYISTVSDTHDRKTVMRLIYDIQARLYPVGRLDADTCGVMLLTNDGALAHRLTHPRFCVKKVYRAWVRGVPESASLKRMIVGLVVDGQKTLPAEVKLITVGPEKHSALLEITISEGRKRQVKKMCAAIGHPVIGLCRSSFAGLKADDLSEGAYRHLTDAEVGHLYCLVKL
ncbi:MAG TPA: pseudouridine synthase [Candidatus Limnocylindrales bacterium]|nr:pseudouridine synthase [Candidatus Limnocylindrales bacterium]